MYLSDRDLEAAIQNGKLIVDPFKNADPTSIDLHLDSVEQAYIWDTKKLTNDNRDAGRPELELPICRMDYGKMSRKYLISPPKEQEVNLNNEKVLVFRRDNQVVLRPGGFLLWQTQEIVGTPETDPEYICFIDGKSTRTARTGLVVHLTAPTIHAGWSGNITLEMANFGPFDLVLHEGDAVAQMIVAKISSIPQRTMHAAGSRTLGQTDVTGRSHSS